MIEVVDGDSAYVLRDKQNNILLLIRMWNGAMSVYARNQQVVIASTSETRELRDWITRRLGETNP